MADERELLKTGIAAAKSGDHARAQAVLQEVVEHFPRSTEGWLWLGLVVEEPLDAEECFQRVLVLDPKNTQARDYLEALKAGHAPELPAEPPPVPAAPPSELDRFRRSLGVTEPVRAEPAHPLPEAKPQAPPKPAPKPATAPATKPRPAQPTQAKPKRRKPGLRLSTGQAVAAGLLGVWAMALLCGAPIVFVMTQLGGRAVVGSVATLVPSPTPGVETQAAPTPQLVATEALLAPTEQAPAEVEAATPVALAIEPALAAGRSLVQAQRFIEARAALLPVVAAAPDQVEAATLLAHADIGALVEAYETEPAGLTPEIARRDIEAAIALDPTQGDLYVLRAFAGAETLRRSSETQPSREAVASAARADLDAATQLGVSGSAYGAWLPLLQARIGRCDDGYKTATQALAVGGRLTGERAWLQYGAALNAYCRARYDEAGAYARQAIETLDADFPQARELEILSLHARKRTTDALQKVAVWFEAVPEAGARRFALRGFLLYETGDREGADADLVQAETLTEMRSALQNYTRGRLTVDFGSDGGWDAVRDAIATLDPAFGFLRERWTIVLAESGQDPVALAEPVGPLEAGAPAVSLNGAPPPNPGLLTPLETGRGPLVLGQIGTVLHYQAAAPLGLGEVQELRLAALGLQTGATAGKIEVSVWDQASERWVAQTLADDGTVLVKQPARFVSAEGDVYISARLLVAERWGVARLTVTITAATGDGQTARFGPDPAAPGDLAALTPLEQAAALMAADQLDRASAVLEQALGTTTVAGERATILDRWAEVALERNDPTEAREHAIAALALESLPERHFVLALALDLAGDTSAARREYELAVAPGNPLSDVSRGLAEGRIEQLTR